MEKMTEKRKKIYKVFNTIQPTNTYPGWLHNNLKLYRAIRHNHPESKIIERMFMEGHLNLFAMKRKWKFAKSIVKSERERERVSNDD